jgi:hypothetical protein
VFTYLYIQVGAFHRVIRLRFAISYLSFDLRILIISFGIFKLFSNSFVGSVNYLAGRGQNDKQRSTKHTHKTKDGVTRTPLKSGVKSGALEG